MKYERLVLMAFFCESLLNTVLTGFVYALPVGDDSSGYDMQYILFALLAAVTVAFFTRWYLKGHPGVPRREALIFGIGGFAVSLVWSFVSGIFGLLYDGGTLSDVWATIPTFVPYIFNVSTVVLALYWIVPAALVGWFVSGRRA